MLTMAAPRRTAPVWVFLTACVLAYRFAPTSNGDVTCLLRIHAGQACPSCGLTRATGRFFHGDFLAAFAYHPYVFLAVGQSAALAAWLVLRSDQPITNAQYLRIATILLVNLGLFLAVWVLRILTGHLNNVY